MYAMLHTAQVLETQRVARRAADLEILRRRAERPQRRATDRVRLAFAPATLRPAH